MRLHRGLEEANRCRLAIAKEHELESCCLASLQQRGIVAAEDGGNERAAPPSS